MTNETLAIVHLVFEQKISEKFSFRKACTKTDCPEQEGKICPHILVNNGKSVVGYKDFLDNFSEKHGLPDPYFVHASIGGDEKRGLLEYLVFFVEEYGFHQAASNLLKETACLNPTYLPLSEIG